MARVFRPNPTPMDPSVHPMTNTHIPGNVKDKISTIIEPSRIFDEGRMLRTLSRNCILRTFQPVKDCNRSLGRIPVRLGHCRVMLDE